MTRTAALSMPWPEDDAPAAAVTHGAPGETARLTRAIRDGDSAAFATFYEAWFDRAFALARSLTRRDESFCLDVVQDAMMRAVRSLPALDDDAVLERWMVRVVHTTALDRLRGERRRVLREERAAARRAADRAARAEASLQELEELLAWVEARLAEATAEERALVRGRFAGGMSYRDLGHTLGMSGNAASGKLARLLGRLRVLAKEVFRDG